MSTQVEAKKQIMQVRIRSPFHDYFDGQAFSLTAENATGVFDVLPHHHNFISLLLPCEIIVRTVHEGELKIRISGGMLHVKADQVIVFLDI
jgi:F0F1-type ATP synthase epsilon subunit